MSGSCSSYDGGDSESPPGCQLCCGFWRRRLLALGFESDHDSDIPGSDVNAAREGADKVGGTEAVARVGETQPGEIQTLDSRYVPRASVIGVTAGRETDLSEGRGRVSARHAHHGASIHLTIFRGHGRCVQTFSSSVMLETMA